MAEYQDIKKLDTLTQLGQQITKILLTKKNKRDETHTAKIGQEPK